MTLPQIDQSRESWALFLFTVQLLLCITGVAISEAVHQDHPNALVTVISIGRTLAPQIVVITATTVVIVEGYAMLAERYLRRRYREGRKDGLQEGLQKANAAWEDWYGRWQQARAEGRPFDEPPPSENVTSNQP